MTSRRSFLSALAALALPWKGKARKSVVMPTEYGPIRTVGRLPYGAFGLPTTPENVAHFAALCEAHRLYARRTTL
jgi:hypothetical protein